jgi:hypothetical protein
MLGLTRCNRREALSCRAGTIRSFQHLPLLPIYEYFGKYVAHRLSSRLTLQSSTLHWRRSGRHCSR